MNSNPKQMDYSENGILKIGVTPNQNFKAAQMLKMNKNLWVSRHNQTFLYLKY